MIKYDEDKTKNARIAYDIVERHILREIELYEKQAKEEGRRLGVQSRDIANALKQIQSMLTDIQINLDE